MLKRIFIVGVLVFSCALPILGSKPVHANISSCSASVNPAVLAPGSTTDLQFLVNNTDSGSVQWVSISSPSANYVVNGGSGGGWNQVSNGSSSVTYQSGSIDPGTSSQLSVNVSTDSSTHPNETWSLAVSDDPNGANPFNCSGSLSTSISGQAPDTTPPNIYNIGVSTLTSNSVKIFWLTDEPATSQVDYGQDSSYGNTGGPIGALVTSHNITLSNLLTDTGYHFSVTSADGSGNSATSSDNTFLTVEPPIGSNGNSNSSINTPIPIKKVPTEKVPPTISLSTPIKNPYKQAPALNGEAADNEAVAGVEYSVDSGKNWLPADKITGLGTKKAGFSFTPQITDDGNYLVAVRAIDTSGNTAQTVPVALVIDRLPPLVGGNIISLGPQILQPDSSGVISTVVGVDQKITLSAVGGPTSINLSAVSKNSKQKASGFALTQSSDNGLWSGILGFEDPGTYTITANSVDGAGNKTSRQLNDIQVSPAGKVIDTKTKKPVTAAVSVYYLQPDSNDWVVWDGAPYGQSNPQKAGQDGQFNLFLPAGKYYLKAGAEGYQNLHSAIFELKQSMPISTDLNMKPADLKLGRLNLSWPDFFAQPISLAAGSKDRGENSLAGQSLPEFKLGSTSGREVNSIDLLGKPTVISLMSTWSPTTAEQLGALAKLQSNKDINVVPVGLQENTGRVRTYSEISGYSLDWLADPDSTLTGSFNIHSLPTHYFIDRKGTVKQVTSGVLTRQQILNSLSSLN